MKHDDNRSSPLKLFDVTFNDVVIKLSNKLTEKAATHYFEQQGEEVWILI